MPATTKTTWTPSRRGLKVVTTEDREMLLTWGGCQSVVIPAGTVGVVTSREYDGGGYNVALMDQTGEVVERVAGYRYEIHFPNVPGLRDWQTCREGGTEVRAGTWDFTSGGLAKAPRARKAA